MNSILSFNDYQQQYKKSIEKPEEFWADVASDFVWRKKWDKVLEWDFHKPEVKWFKGGKLNITENCIDRHLPHVPIKPQLSGNQMIRKMKPDTLPIRNFMNKSAKLAIC